MNPFKFTENRVWRVYKGGLLLDKLREKKFPADDFYPEDWIASMVKANNYREGYENEGLSTVIWEGQEISFADLIKQYPEEMLGRCHLDKNGAIPGFLTKLLDSAIRLPIQAHPDRQASRKLYNSEYGKTEAWIVLNTREIDSEKPYLMLGFNDKLDKDVFLKESMTGEMEQSLEMVHKHEVKAGDVLLLRGGIVHAIGPGIFMLEIMEPTDLVTQPELYCGNKRLSIADRFGSVPPEKALEVFHFTPEAKEAVWERCAVKTAKLEENGNYELISLLDREKIGYFGAEKLIIKKSGQLSNKENICKVGIVTQGNLNLKTEGSSLDLKAGDSFFIPACIEGYNIEGKGEIIFALPPK